MTITYLKYSQFALRAHPERAIALTSERSQSWLTANGLTSALLTLLVSVGVGLLSVSTAIASPTMSKVIALNAHALLDTEVNEAEASTQVAQSAEPTSPAPAEIDTSITREYEPVTIYLPDSSSQELVPQSVLVATDAPVTMAVNQIVDQYEGQDVGITSYEVDVDAQAREAAINFEVNHPRGGNVFQSLSSANQYSLFEAIRETLLTQPIYGIDEVIFQANDTPFDI